MEYHLRISICVLFHGSPNVFTAKTKKNLVRLVLNGLCSNGGSRMGHLGQMSPPLQEIAYKIEIL